MSGSYKLIMVFLLAIGGIGISTSNARFIDCNAKLFKSDENGRSFSEPGPETSGVVHPEHCDGLGEFVQMRVSECGIFPCELKTITVIEVDFKPAKTSRTPKLRMTFIPKGRLPEIWEDPIEDFLLEAGVTSTLKLTDFTEIITSLKEVTVRLAVLDDSNIPEICVSGIYNMDPTQYTDTIVNDGTNGGMTTWLSVSTSVGVTIAAATASFIL